MSEEQSKSAAHSASIKLEGAASQNFEIVKKRCEDVLPGVVPNNADVLRNALHLAALKIKSEGDQ